ncbi:ribosomal RNA large subunit methyltransferase E [Lampropedia cohaerens]|uniref:Ribosomal RNA large subunit methyltransferase E n=1 Tax=Lampropedia cohaerens TaxID=1610491 RepID=A0A0U1Q2B2_9BURK|nr:RlmE family RNA methyltransferase [Lampropedia cohaerens]KKW68898.1 ribosomal RNA large subunit methyltransferase E [Lampropedia cohaerens]
MATKNKPGKVNQTWLHDHINDPYVKQAQKDGYRARAAYKLKEIDEVHKLFDHVQVVVDLGCAPGAWCQYLSRKMELARAVGDGAPRVIGIDLLPMEPVPGVRFIQGDFQEESLLEQLEAALAGRPLDAVVSDMAPNLSGHSATDGARVEALVELAVDFAASHLKPQGVMVAKVFHGPGYDALVQLFRATFVRSKPFKPKASRPRSAEVFLIGMGVRGA